MGAEQLADWMRRRGFNQADAARYLNFPKPYMSNLLSGEEAPGLRRALWIERHTGIPVESWTGELDEMVEAESSGSDKRRVAK